MNKLCEKACSVRAIILVLSKTKIKRYMVKTKVVEYNVLTIMKVWSINRDRLKPTKSVILDHSQYNY